MNASRDSFMQIRGLDPRDPAAASLLRRSDAYLEPLYPPESNHQESIAGLCHPSVAFFVAFVGGKAAGCAGVKIQDDDGRYGEIKRVFVAETHRGRGIAKALMRRLEAHLVEHGVDTARLETGVRQPEALALYRRLGYRERPPFGRYAADPLSVFMEKRLDRDGAEAEAVGAPVADAGRAAP